MTRTVERVEPGSRERAVVLVLHRKAKSTLGFLPDAGFLERAEEGRLWAAIDDGRVVGYLLFDPSGDYVKVRHLCVSEAARGTGVVKLLMSELADEFSALQWITLECRRDYGLERMCEALGLTPIADRPGRSL